MVACAAPALFSFWVQRESGEAVFGATVAVWRVTMEAWWTGCRSRVRLVASCSVLWWCCSLVVMSHECAGAAAYMLDVQLYRYSCRHGAVKTSITISSTSYRYQVPVYVFRFCDLHLETCFFLYLSCFRGFGRRRHLCVWTLHLLERPGARPTPYTRSPPPAGGHHYIRSAAGRLEECAWTYKLPPQCSCGYVSHHCKHMDPSDGSQAMATAT